MINTTFYEEKFPGITDLIGRRYVEIKDDLGLCDMEGYLPVLRCGIFEDIVLEKNIESDDDMTVADGFALSYKANNIDCDAYVLYDIDGYGSAFPVCVDYEEGMRLVKEWYNLFDDEEEAEDAFYELWHEADAGDIAEYGVYRG